MDVLGRTSRTTPRIALILAAASAMVFAVLVPLGGVAFANHGTRTLQLTPETSANSAGATHTITATLSATPDPGPPPDSIEIDFEIAGPGDVDGGDTPASPDRTCTITNPATTCTVAYSSAVAGTDTIRGWIDHDKNNATLVGEADVTEGADAGNPSVGEPAGGTDVPGEQTEPDTTDVVAKTWSSELPRNIDLEPETATNAPGSVHEVTATVTDVFGNPVPGVVVTFTETGPGTFRNDGSQITATTDALGEALAEVTTLASETGDQTITAALPTTAGVDECEKAAGDPAGSTAGNCSDDVVTTWQAAATCPGFAGDSRNQVIGTPGDDVLVGTDQPDVICGLGGDDTLRGNLSRDVLKGGGGDDTMKGGGGNDTLLGGPGPDDANGNKGRDKCRSAAVQRSCEV